MEKRKVYTAGLAIAACCTLVSPAAASAAPTNSSSSGSTTYNVGYFATNHGFLRFHVGTRKFFDSPGTLLVHEGDKVNITEDAGPQSAHVTGVTVAKESPSGVIHITKTTHTGMTLKALKPGTVTIDFRRGNFAKPGTMVLEIVR